MVVVGTMRGVDGIDGLVVGGVLGGGVYTTTSSSTAGGMVQAGAGESIEMTSRCFDANGGRRISAQSY